MAGKVQKTHDEFINEVYDSVGYEYEALEEYKGTRVKVLFKHMICGCEWRTTPYLFLRGTRCPECAIKNRRTSHEEFVSKIHSLVGNEYEVLSKYKTNQTKVSMKHKKCNHEWEIRPARFLQGTRCPKCARDKTMVTHVSFIREVYDLVSDEYEVLEEYKGRRHGILFRHNTCGHEWKIRPDNFLHGKRCPVCSSKNVGKARALTQKEFENKVRQVKGESYLVLGKYINNRTKIKVEHKSCGNIYRVSPDQIMSGRGCPVCSTIKAARKKALSQNEFIDRLKNRWGNDYKTDSEYVNWYTPVIMEHLKCGYKWSVSPGNFINQGGACPKCRDTKSKGEEKITDYLNHSLYRYKAQFTLDGCRDKRPLPFDFAIFHKDKLLCLIEYEGRQHYEPIEYWGGDEHLKGVQRRDRIKRNYCKSNNVPLIEIPYWEEDIEGILQSELNKIHQMNNIKHEQLSMFN